jgi:hypothetical protein
MSAGKLGYLPAAMWRADILAFVVWVLPALIQAATAGTMLGRRQILVMPWFFALLCEELLAAFVTSVPYFLHSSDLYFYLFWAFRIVSFILELGVIYNVFSSVFGAFDGLRRLSVVLFRWISVVLILLATVSGAAAHGNEQTRIFAGLIVLERSVRLVQVGLLFSIFLLSSFFGVAWKNHAFGVALGLAIITSLQLSVIAMRADFGLASRFWFELLTGLGEVGGYSVAWFFLARRVKERAWGRLPVTELDSWNQSLEGLLNR